MDLEFLKRAFVEKIPNFTLGELHQLTTSDISSLIPELKNGKCKEVFTSEIQSEIISKYQLELLQQIATLNKGQRTNEEWFFPCRNVKSSKNKALNKMQYTMQLEMKESLGITLADDIVQCAKYVQCKQDLPAHTCIASHTLTCRLYVIHVDENEFLQEKIINKYCNKKFVNLNELRILWNHKRSKQEIDKLIEDIQREASRVQKSKTLYIR